MIVEQLIAPVSGLLDKFIPDADQKAKLAHEIATLSEKQHQEIMLQQIADGLSRQVEISQATDEKLGTLIELMLKERR